MELKVYIDGGAINNPGPAAMAFIVYLNERAIFNFSKRLGINTNNFAEYSALTSALEWVKNNKKRAGQISKIVCFSDSNLMVNQLNGFFKVKSPTLRDFIMKIRLLELEIGVPVVYKFIPREENRLADSLVKKTLTPVF